MAFLNYRPTRTLSAGRKITRLNSIGSFNEPEFLKAQKGLRGEIGRDMSYRRSQLAGQGYGQDDIDRMLAPERIGAQAAFGNLYSDEAGRIKQRTAEKRAARKAFPMELLGTVLPPLLGGGGRRRVPSLYDRFGGYSNQSLSGPMRLGGGRL